jgi:hypothetical protein
MIPHFVHKCEAVHTHSYVDRSCCAQSTRVDLKIKGGHHGKVDHAGGPCLCAGHLDLNVGVDHSHRPCGHPQSGPPNSVSSALMLPPLCELRLQMASSELRLPLGTARGWKSDRAEALRSHPPSPTPAIGGPPFCVSRLLARRLAEPAAPNSLRRPAHSRCHLVVTRIPKASASSLPPWLLRLLPAGAFCRVGFTPTGKRRLLTAHTLLGLVENRYHPDRFRVIQFAKPASGARRRFKSEVQQCSIDGMAE